MSVLTAEQVRVAIFNNSSYASYDGARYYADGIVMQAIADELNSRAERTCHVVEEQHNDYGYQTQVDDYTFKLSCGHIVTWDDLPDYCPSCGAKVVNDA